MKTDGRTPRRRARPLGSLLLLLMGCGPHARGQRAPIPDDARGATLVVLEEAEGTCAVRTLGFPSGARRDLVRIPGDCFGGRLSFRFDLERLLVWFDPETRHAALYYSPRGPGPGHADEQGHGSAPRLYEVDVAARTARELPPPATPDPCDEIGYDQRGALVALSSHWLTDLDEGRTTYLGRDVRFADPAVVEGAVVATYQLDGGAWSLADVTPTAMGKDGDPGWRAAPAAAHLGPSSLAALDFHLDAASADPIVRAAVARRRAPPVEWGWLTVDTAAGPVSVWALDSERLASSGRIAWADAAGKRTVLPSLGFTAGELVSIRFRGRYLLVAGARAGAFPRLYDLARKTQVFASETARAAMFWPRSAVGPERPRTDSR